MKTIWKYALPVLGETRHMIPRDSVALAVGLDPSGQPAIWIEVDPESLKVEVMFIVSGTGQPIPEGPRKYLGLFVAGPVVGHVWLSDTDPE